MATIDRLEGKKGVAYRARARVRVRGFPQYVETFQKLSEAKAWAQQIENDIRKGQVVNVVDEGKKRTLY